MRTPVLLFYFYWGIRCYSFTELLWFWSFIQGHVIFIHPFHRSTNSWVKLSTSNSIIEHLSVNVIKTWKRTCLWLTQCVHYIIQKHLSKYNSNKNTEHFFPALGSYFIVLRFNKMMKSTQQNKLVLSCKSFGKFWVSSGGALKQSRKTVSTQIVERSLCCRAPG